MIYSAPVRPSAVFFNGLIHFEQTRDEEQSGRLAEAGHRADDGGFELFRLHRCVVTDRVT